MTTVEAMQNLTAVHWRRASVNHMESACGRYAIWRVHPRTDESPTYTLWEKVRGEWSYRDKFASADEAKGAISG